MNILQNYDKLVVGFSERGNPIYWNPKTNNNALLAGQHAWGMIQPIVDSGKNKEFQFAVANINHADRIESAISHANSFEELEWMIAWVYKEYSARCNAPLMLIDSYPKIICIIRGLEFTDNDFIETLRFLIVNGHYVGIHFIVVYDEPSQVSPLINLDFQMRAIVGSYDANRRFFGFPTCNMKYYIESFEFSGSFKVSSNNHETDNGIRIFETFTE